MNQPFPAAPAKKPFRFQMWMLGALILPVGIGFAVRDLLKTNSIDLGGECSSSKHCKSGTCLNGNPGICTKSCSGADGCPPGFACTKVSVTLKNQAGFHDLGAQNYCMPAKDGAGPTDAPSISSAAMTATPPPPATASAEAPSPSPSPSAKPKPKKPHR